MQKLSTVKGLLLVISGGICWGASGALAQYMFHTQNISPVWVTGIRLFIAGIILLSVYVISTHHSVFLIWSKKKNWLNLLGFGLLGMMPSQLFYFLGINYSNAATATTLQFTSPIFIMGYLSYKQHHIKIIDALLVIGTIFGIVILATRGQFTTLDISPIGLLYGLLGGIAGASYTLTPLKLVKRYNPELLCGWGMIIGSIPILLCTPLIKQPELNISLDIELILIIIIGTVLAYSLYISSLKYISPMITGILSSVEPLTTTLFSVIFLKYTFNTIELLGGAIILIMVIFTIIFG